MGNATANSLAGLAGNGDRAVDTTATESATPGPTRREMAAGAAALFVGASGVAAAIAKHAAAGAQAATVAAPPTTIPPVVPVVTGPAPAPPSTAAPVAPPTTAAPAAAPGRPPLTPEQRALHAARRLTFGPTPGLLAEVRANGADWFVAQQLQPASIDDSAVERLLGGFQFLDRSYAQIRDSKIAGIDTFTDRSQAAVLELRQATLLRAVYSQRQLYELVVDFWTNHFNVWVGKDLETGAMKIVDDRKVIRPNAMGRFADLLLATARGAAMLRYLDNDMSTGENPNENYGRELLELHTVGVEGGYNEDDVRNCALALSGWGTDSDGIYRFVPQQHFTGPLRVMGWSTPGVAGPAGEADAVALIDYLAHHPSTAQHIALKLCRRFVADDPPPGVVVAAARAFLDNDTAIVPVLATIFSHEDFWYSGGQKLRRPFEFLAAALRATGAGVDPNAGSVLNDSLASMGQRLFDWIPPTGYPDEASAWLGSGGMLGRWNLARDLAAGGLDQVAVDLAALIGGGGPRTGGQLVDAVLGRVHGAALPADRRAALLAYVGAQDATPLDGGQVSALLPDLFALALSTAEFHYR